MSDINEQAKGVSSEHLGEAARMWCEKETEKIVMIPELAVVIAKSLQSRDAKIQKLESDLKTAKEALMEIEEGEYNCDCGKPACCECFRITAREALEKLK